MKIFGRLITYPLTYGPITSLYAGTAPAASELNGKVGPQDMLVSCCNDSHVITLFFQYLTAWARVTLPHNKALDPELEKKLWEWCEEQVKDI